MMILGGAAGAHAQRGPVKIEVPAAGDYLVWALGTTDHGQVALPPAPFTGTSTLPNIMKRSTKVMAAMIRSASGRSATSESIESTSCADCCLKQWICPSGGTCCPTCGR